MTDDKECTEFTDAANETPHTARPAATPSGIIVVDKPPDWTSHDVVAKLRGILKTKRIGHGGTLDPMATGVLPVFVGRATRAAEHSENAEKEYLAGLRLGIVTDTQDTTGNVIRDQRSAVSGQGSEVSIGEQFSAAGIPNSTVDTITRADVEACIKHFLGPQKQTPPMYSAIKIGGKKLVDLARRGQDIPRPARDINIAAIEILGGQGSDYTLRVVCSKGTYIRTLCHDIGAALGCGAAMSSLRRTRAGIFDEGMAHTLDEIKTIVEAGMLGEIIIPVDSIFAAYPSIALDATDTGKCKHGQPIAMPGKPDGTYRFYGPDGGFLMLGGIADGKAKTIKTFFDP
jgi:tRNA pseudouridine55 synthase